MAEGVEILAEPGSTHEGRPEWMLDLIDLAKRSGCDTMKWQFLSSAARLCERRGAPGYFNAYRLIEGTPELWAMLVRETHARGLRAVATVYLPEDVAPIADVGVDAIKVASFEAGDGVLLHRAARTGIPLMISTGMMEQTEVDTLLTRVQPETLFHCCSKYDPPPLPEALNLRVLRQWDRVFRHHRLGWSDHSADYEIGGIAVGYGAQALEVHMRHPETPATNADYTAALAPAQLAEYVRIARKADVAGGDGVKRVQEVERAMQKYKVRP
jgi:sialic acid synthase SpsE